MFEAVIYIYTVYSVVICSKAIPMRDWNRRDNFFTLKAHTLHVEFKLYIVFSMQKVNIILFENADKLEEIKM